VGRLVFGASDNAGAPVSSVLSSAQPGDSDGFGTLGRRANDGGVGPGSFAGGGVGARWTGLPGFGLRPRAGTARFEDLSLEGPLAPGIVRVRLAQASHRALACLRAAGYRTPVDVAVRFTVRPPTVIDGVFVAAAPAIVERCLHASLTGMVLGPVAAPARVSGSFRGSVGP
jgi:hypothetical protein